MGIDWTLQPMKLKQFSDNGFGKGGMRKEIQPTTFHGRVN